MYILILNVDGRSEVDTSEVFEIKVRESQDFCHHISISSLIDFKLLLYENYPPLPLDVTVLL